MVRREGINAYYTILYYTILYYTIHTEYILNYILLMSFTLLLHLQFTQSSNQLFCYIFLYIPHIVLFGDMLDELNKDPNGFADGIAKISISFCGVAAANLLSGTLQVYCWTLSGERQSQKLREVWHCTCTCLHIHMVLSTDIASIWC